VNELYAKQCSEKIRAIIKHKGLSGGRLTCRVPYGYIIGKDENGKRNWVIDEETAAVIREVFDLYVNQGMGITYIAKHLSAKKIITPITRLGIKHQGINTEWDYATISRFLVNQEYCGDTVNFKSTVRSYKDKRIIRFAPENWKIFENTHAAIIDRETFEKSVIKRGQKRRYTHYERENPLRYFLFCANCGSRMYVRRTQLKNSIAQSPHDTFVCHKYTNTKGIECSSHYVSEQYIFNILFEKISELVKLFKEDKKDFEEAIYLTKKNNVTSNQTFSAQKIADLDREIETAQSRLKKIYIEKENGEISRDVFSTLAEQFSLDIEQLKKQRAALERLSNELKKERNDVKTFLQTLEKLNVIEYNSINEKLLGLLIERIVVSERSFKYSHVEPTLTIYWLGVGVIEFV
jgi:hypothetical protein